MGQSKLDGTWGEALAAEYLRKKHYKIVAHQFRTRFGEIDLVAQNWRYIVFVEVKLRKNTKFAAPVEYVDRRKQDNLQVAASIYLSRYPSNRKPRFDVIEVYAPEGAQTKDPVLKHMEDAF